MQCMHYNNARFLPKWPTQEFAMHGKLLCSIDLPALPSLEMAVSCKELTSTAADLLNTSFGDFGLPPTWGRSTRSPSR